MLCEEIVTRHHDSELAGHPGYTKMHELITRNYWWPQILEDIKQYVAGCERCQATKPNQQPKRNNLHPNEIPRGPWEIISIDLIGQLPELSGYDGILVIVDCFSKMARCHKLHLVISPPILRRFPRSQSQLKTLKKTFRSIPVTS